MKSLIIFDLDGTLAESKSDLDGEMATLLARLLGTVDVAIISGGAWAQFEKQVLAFLTHDERLKRLSLLPTCGTKFYRFDGAWTKLYSEDFTAAEKKKIMGARDQAVRKAGFEAEKHWGAPIEDRDSQVTFFGSGGAVGRKRKMGSRLRKAQGDRSCSRAADSCVLNPFGAALPRSTSPGRGHKAYGVKKLHETLGIAIADMIFIGDAIFPGGNDYPAK